MVSSDLRSWIDYVCVTFVNPLRTCIKISEAFFFTLHPYAMRCNFFGETLRIMRVLSDHNVNHPHKFYVAARLRSQNHVLREQIHSMISKCVFAIRRLSSLDSA